MEAGRINYQVNAQRYGVDIYEMAHDKQTGFYVKLVGFHPSEKVTGFSWSPAGEMFLLQEKEGLMTATKHIWSFYMIIQSDALQETGGAANKSRQGIKATKATAFMAKQNTMSAADITYEFRKTARHEMQEAQTEASWD